MFLRNSRFALPLCTAFLLAMLACDDAATPTEPVGGDEPEPVITVPIADVNAYFEGLPKWEEYSAPQSDADVVSPEPSFYEQSGDRFCSVTEASITRNPEDIVTYSPDSEILWLGSLIQGRGHRDGLGSLLELPIRQRFDR